MAIHTPLAKDNLDQPHMHEISQYIAAGVKASIQDDFSRPIADAGE